MRLVSRLSALFLTFVLSAAFAPAFGAGNHDKGAAGIETAGDVTLLSAGGYFTCVLTTGGDVECWGDNEFGQLGDGSTTRSSSPVSVDGLGSGVTDVSAGYEHACAVVNGGVKCWGDNQFGKLGDGTTNDSVTPVDVSGLTSGVSAVSAGGDHTCALTTGGGVRCWGRNEYGELGNSSTADSWTPVDVTGLTGGVTAIAAGGFHTCALTEGGGGKCWGAGAYGRLGNGGTGNQSAPVDVSTLTSGVSAVDAGNDHTCALTTGGGVTCWGHNDSGQLGNGGTSDSSTPVNVSGLGSGVSATTVGGAHSCAATDGGAAKCWGRKNYGQLGNGGTSNSSIPVDVSGLSGGVAATSSGMFHSCARTASGDVTCWGSNFQGQAGDGTVWDRYAPVPVVGITGGGGDVDAGGNHTCAVVSGGVKCWGGNGSGQLGNGEAVAWPAYGYESSPVDVLSISTAVHVSAGGGDTSGHTCALLSTGALKCWGDNSVGQLGDGGTTGSDTPVNVSGMGSGVTAIAAGFAHTCAVVNGSARCWGYNSEGQLGYDGDYFSTTPVTVTGLISGVTAIAAGEEHSCAIVGGGAKCWGSNSTGQLGNSSTTNSSTPVDVTGLTSGVSALTVGESHTCALTTNGAVKCWGYNGNGQLGNGETSTYSSAPVDVSGLGSGGTSVAAGQDHSCAVVAGAAKCWGYNLRGQLGDGSTTIRPTPVQVYGLSTGVSAVTTGDDHSCALTTGGAISCWGYNSFGQLGDGVVFYYLEPNVVDFGSALTPTAYLPAVLVD